MKIFLVGFMAAGKSLVGRMLAEKMGMAFLDLDEYIESEQKCSIASLFDDKGETHFRMLEARALRKTADLEPSIIATGGGTPCFHNNMEWMNEAGLTIFMEIKAETIVARLQGEKNHRPLVRGKSDQELMQFVANKLTERMAFYNQAQFVCHGDAAAHSIVTSMGQYFGRFTKISRK